MLPFSFVKSNKNGSKIHLERHRFFDRFWHRFFVDFGSVLIANLASKGSPWKGVLIAKFALGPFQTPPKTRLTARTRPDDKTGPEMNPPTSKICPMSRLQRLKTSPRCFFSGGFAAFCNRIGGTNEVGRMLPKLSPKPEQTSGVGLVKNSPLFIFPRPGGMREAIK